MRYKKTVLAVLIFLFVLLTASCGKDERIPINKTVADLLSEEKATNCSVVSLGDYSSFTVQVNSPKVTAKEYDENFTEETKGYGDLTEDFVRTEFGFGTIDEFKKDVDRRYLEHLKVLQILSAREKIITYLLGIAQFDLSDDDIAEVVQANGLQEQNYAVLYGYETFDDYLREEFNLSEEQFLQKCYAQAENEVKKCLLIGAVAERENVVVQEGEDIYATYQDLENAVYELFMDVDADF